MIRYFDGGTDERVLRSVNSPWVCILSRLHLTTVELNLSIKSFVSQRVSTDKERCRHRDRLWGIRSPLRSLKPDRKRHGFWHKRYQKKSKVRYHHGSKGQKICAVWKISAQPENRRYIPLLLGCYMDCSTDHRVFLPILIIIHLSLSRLANSWTAIIATFDHRWERKIPKAWSWKR